VLLGLLGRNDDRLFIGVIGRRRKLNPYFAGIDFERRFQQAGDMTGEATTSATMIS
jgi:hypothetical protein